MEIGSIDYVVPFVFHDDYAWQESYCRVKGKYDESDVINFVRFRSWGTEELLIRCVRKFMPFVRTIYILLAQESQKKEWMNQDGVTVVYHREFIPEQHLPTFNSCTIEMFLHRIPGISDRFIYGNDDMYPVSPLTADYFFVGDVPKQKCHFVPMPLNANIFHSLCLSGLNFVASEFGLHYTNALLKNGHGMTPILKSTCEYLWHRGQSMIEDSISAFREGKNFSQWIYPWWHHLSGNYIEEMTPTRYVSMGCRVQDMVNAVYSCRGIVCVNDNECVLDYQLYASALREILNVKLNNAKYAE